MKDLDPYARWMAKNNIEYAKAEGVEVVVTRLRAHGYTDVAEAVAEHFTRTKTCHMCGTPYELFPRLSALTADLRDGTEDSTREEVISDLLDTLEQLLTEHREEARWQ